MSTLDSSSTRDEVKAAYDDNASYFEDNDRAKALAFVTAATLWIRMNMSLGSQGGSQIQLPIKQWENEKESAKEWLKSGGGLPASSRGGRNFARLMK